MGIICCFSNHGLNCTTSKSSAPAQDLWSLTWSVIYGRNSNNPTLWSLLQCQIWLDSVAPEDPVVDDEIRLLLLWICVVPTGNATLQAVFSALASKQQLPLLRSTTGLLYPWHPNFKHRAVPI
eukprot:jgi/Psemu1/21402/gm1.21402_g